MPPIEEALCSNDGSEFRFQDLERHIAVVANVVGEIDRGHPALADLTLDSVAAL